MSEKIPQHLAEKIKKIRLFASDLDGTLLLPDGTVSPRTHETVLRMMDRGYYFTFATGRQANVLWRIAGVIPTNAPLVCTNGGEVAVFENGKLQKICRRQCHKTETVRDLVAFCLRERLHFLCRRPSGELVDSSCPSLSSAAKRQQEAHDAGEQVLTMDVLTSAESELLDADDFIKLLVWVGEEREQRLVEEFVAAHPEIIFTCSWPGVVELMPPGAEKSEGIREVCRLLGLSMEQCCVFGDYDNDLPMFRAAGLSVAMANGNERVRAAADYVTAANAEDGVAQVMERFFL